MKKFLIALFASFCLIISSIEAIAQNDSDFVYKDAFVSANETLLVSFETSKNLYISIEICDALGNRISLEIVEAFPGSTVEKIDVSNLLPGAYFVSIYEEQKVLTRRIVIRE